jgi:hypothetical protein
MQRFIFLILIITSSFASLFSPARNRPLYFAAFSFGTVNAAIISTDVSPDTSPESCFELYGFHLSFDNSFTEHFGVVAHFSTCFENHVNPFGTTDEIKFSMCNFCGPQARLAHLSRFIPATAVVADVLRNLTVKHDKSSLSGTDRNTSFAMNFGYKPSDAFGGRPVRFSSDTNFSRNHTVELTNRIRFIVQPGTNGTLKPETTEPLGREPCRSFYNFESCWGAPERNGCGSAGVKSSPGFMN